MLAQTKTAAPSIVNGINLDDLFALVEGVKRDAAKGKTNWRVTTTWQGQTRSRAKIESFGIGGEQVRVNSRSTSTNLVNWADRTGSPTRRNIYWRRSTPA